MSCLELPNRLLQLKFQEHLKILCFTLNPGASHKMERVNQMPSFILGEFDLVSSGQERFFQGRRVPEAKRETNRAGSPGPRSRLMFDIDGDVTVNAICDGQRTITVNQRQ